MVRIGLRIQLVDGRCRHNRGRELNRVWARCWGREKQPVSVRDQRVGVAGYGQFAGRQETLRRRDDRERWRSYPKRLQILGTVRSVEGACQRVDAVNEGGSQLSQVE